MGLDNDGGVETGQADGTGNSDGSGWRTLIPVRRDTRKHNEVPIETVGLFSFLTYAWLDRFMWRAFRRRSVHEADLWTCPAVDGAQSNAAILSAMWEQEKRAKRSSAQLFSVCMRFLRMRHVVGFCLMLAAFTAIIVAQAYVSMRLLVYLSSPDGTAGLSRGYGISLVVALFAAQLAYSVFFMAVFSVTHIAGIRLRSGLLTLVYQKLLRLSSTSRGSGGGGGGEGTASTGQYLALFAVDATRLLDGASFVPVLLGPPLLAVAATVYALFLLGAWALVGFAVLLLLFPLQMAIGKTIMHFRSHAIVNTDSRVKMMSETLTHAKFLKMCTWEAPLARLITDIRQREKLYLERANLCVSLAMLTSALVVAAATMLTLILYSLLGNDLTFVQAFTYLVLYSSITSQLDLATMTIKYVSEFKVAVDRIQAVLSLPEVLPCLPLEHESVPVDGAHRLYSLELHDVSTVWDTGGGVEGEDGHAENGIADGMQEELQVLKDTGFTSHNALSDVTCRINKGDVVGVTGPVGGGKSALIYSILGQLTLTSGEIVVSGTIAYVPQTPWVFSGTVRDNVTFHMPYDKSRYREVLEACCLTHDLDLMPDGDLTQIGERGVNLSGGQKHRISIARAVYSNRDIVLLDDPFSALDPDVAEEIYSRVIQGRLVGKTVIMATHNIKFLPDCDHILHVSGGTITEQGSHQDLIDLNANYAYIIAQHYPKSDGTYPQYSHQMSSSTAGGGMSDDELNLYSEPTSPVHQEHREPMLVARTSDANADKPLQQQQPQEQEEEKAVGSVSAATYRAYMRAAGGAAAVVTGITVAVLAESSRAFSYWWLGHWLSQGGGNTTIITGNETTLSMSISDNPHLQFYNLIYGLSLLAIIIFFAVRSVTLVKLMMRASNTLHGNLLSRVLAGPMSFFDTTPHGQILNRFSKDQDEMDSGLPPMVDNTIKNIISIIIHLIMIGAIIHWFLLAVPFMVALFLLVYVVFRVGVRETKRLQNISMSPLLGLVSSTINGLACVQAYSKEKQLLSRFCACLDHNTATLMIYVFTMRWINVRLSVITASMVAVTALTLVLGKHAVQPEFAGVVLIYAVQLTTLLQFMVRSAVESEARFTSGERILNYIEHVPQEKVSEKDGTDPVPGDWPSKGSIAFDSYSMRYRPELPLALRELSLTIQPQEKVGIVGRTGAGKSSLATALYRLREAASGTIKIDSVDISCVSLQRLRSRLAIIPQEPVLFSGSIRHNLDPFCRHIDHELWRALDKCHLKEKVWGMDGRLNSVVSEGGANLSVGERQLLCLARVMLQHARILILDEATASMDAVTSAHLHEALHAAFTDCTVLVIAHRMDTVLATCQRVLVMEDGQVLEFGEPAKLLSDPGSHFYHLLHVTSQPPRALLRQQSTDPDPTNAWV